MIDADPRTTPEAKLKSKAHWYRKISEQVAQARRDHASEVEANRRRLEQAAFAYPSDPDAFRNALVTAESKITTADQAAAALRRARRTDDPVLAHAVFVLASERGYSGIAAEYAKSHPETAAALQNLAAHDLADDTPEEAMFSSLRPPMRPTGLPTDDARIARLAEDSGEPPFQQSDDVVLRAR
jgi:hypothetical protein